MVLVDYSESEASGSESEAPPPARVPPPGPKPAPAKKPFQKVVDRSNRGKIIVNLPRVSAVDDKDGRVEEPPAKRARTAGGGLFSGFNALLPAPKNAGKAPPRPTAGQAVRPIMSLKTSADPGFRRETEPVQADGSEKPKRAPNLPSPNFGVEASEPHEQEQEVQIKPVGKPLMFRPLSVSRNTNKKKTAAGGAPKVSTEASAVGGATEALRAAARAPAPKKAPLFSLHSEDEPKPATTTSQASRTYKPLFEINPQPEVASQDYDHLAAQTPEGPSPATGPRAERLDSIADDLNLSAAARRELFGRGGGDLAAKQVVNFNMDQEYQHNESIRANGDQQIHNPIRSIQGGKHSLRQLVQKVQNQREALEESFAQGKSNRKEASSRYGWR
ncbi:hypothetical protein CDD83_1257 [Cordyceps sp. RAO-2017]|nr:hypothetical protein CDD83_1257 [Cordyceps sp. RAO-2017]